MVAFYEAHNSPDIVDGANPSRIYTHIITDEQDEQIARPFFITSTPDVVSGLLRRQIDWSRHSDGWLARTHYGVEKLQDPANDPDFSFSTRGGTSRITQSKQTVERFAVPGRTPADYHGAIGVTKDTVKGTQIVTPRMEFSVTVYIDASLFTHSYRRTLYYATGKVSSDPFLGMAAKETLFMGAEAARGGATADGTLLVRITYHFAASPNITFDPLDPIAFPGLTAGRITEISKNGWDYIWFSYAKTKDTASGLIITEPVEAHVERLYDATTFSAFGLY
jgi:hypothetical protein